MRDVVAQYGGRVRFVTENWGDSKLAARFGVKRYPVVFVNDVLVAKPNDFGWTGEKGKYTPWRDPANHEKFKRDLKRMIDVALADPAALARDYRANPATENELAALPALNMKKLDGTPIQNEKLAGRVVVVEFWATWCPPCLSTLGWLGESARRYGDRVAFLAIAVDSKEEEVRAQLSKLKASPPVAMGDEATISAFGSLNSIPTMYVFDRQGRTAAVFYGAPADLHRRVSELLDELAK